MRHTLKVGDDEVKVGNKVKVGGRVEVGDKVKVSDKVKVGGRVKVGNKVKVSDKVKVGDRVKVSDKVKVTPTARSSFCKHTPYNETLHCNYEKKGISMRRSMIKKALMTVINAFFINILIITF